MSNGMVLVAITLGVPKLAPPSRELLKTIARLKGILADPRKVLGIIEEELKELKEKYGDERRTKITGAAQELDIEDLAGWPTPSARPTTSASAKAMESATIADPTPSFPQPQIDDGFGI